MHLWRQSEDANLYTVPLYYSVRLDESFHAGSGEVVVCAYDRELCHAEKARHVLKAEVKLMVSYCRCIIAHHVHQLYLYITFEHSVVGRALREVTTVEEQQVGIVLPLLFYHLHSSNESAAVSL